MDQALGLIPKKKSKVRVWSEVEENTLLELWEHFRKLPKRTVSDRGSLFMKVSDAMASMNLFFTSRAIEFKIREFIRRYRIEKRSLSNLSVSKDMPVWCHFERVKKIVNDQNDNENPIVVLDSSDEEKLTPGPTDSKTSISEIEIQKELQNLFSQLKKIKIRSDLLNQRIESNNEKLEIKFSDLKIDEPGANYIDGFTKTGEEEELTIVRNSKRLPRRERIQLFQSSERLLKQALEINTRSILLKRELLDTQDREEQIFNSLIMNEEKLNAKLAGNVTYTQRWELAANKNDPETNENRHIECTLISIREERCTDNDGMTTLW